MPIQLPNLDDRTYDDLVAEALHLIPTYAPEWTNYNPSDPGITLIEVFAYLTELLIYRLDRVTDENKAMFLKLIDAPEFQSQPTLDGKIRKTIEVIRTTDRAITRADFERLALQSNPQIARAHCIPKINLLSDSNTRRSAYVSIVVVPKEGKVSQNQIDTVAEYLDERRLITTRISVVAPVFLEIGVQAKLFLNPDAIADKVKESAKNKLQNFFDPLKGGQTGTGWEFGRSIYISEIYELLDKLSGVDYVEAVTILKRTNEDLPWVTVSPQLMEISLRMNELVDFRITSDDDITIGGLQ
jgi:Baseplate J-like protein